MNKQEINKVRQQYNSDYQAEKVYCIDRNFLNIAIQEIGEERLMRYLKGE